MMDASALKGREAMVKDEKEGRKDVKDEDMRCSSP